MVIGHVHRGNGDGNQSSQCRVLKLQREGCPHLPELVLCDSGLGPGVGKAPGAG